MKTKWWVMILGLGAVLLIQFGSSIMDSLFFYTWRAEIRNFLLHTFIPQWIITHFVVFLLLKILDLVWMWFFAVVVGAIGWKYAKGFCFWLVVSGLRCSTR